MKAIQVPRHGPPDVLTLVDLPVPTPQPNEILVKAHSIGVGIPDLLIRAGTYRWMPKMPAVPGTELSGTVEAVGAAVTLFKKGDLVLVSAREKHERGGCYAEFVTAAQDAVFPLPAADRPRRRGDARQLSARLSADDRCGPAPSRPDRAGVSPRPAASAARWWTSPAAWGSPRSASPRARTRRRS